jgi:predicted Zn-ribbon and HTH transcriptional regulator
MDIADAAYQTEQLELKQFLTKARYEFRVGPRQCSKCGEYNDRSFDGYCICSECMIDSASPAYG